MKFRSSRSTYGASRFSGSRYVSYDEIKYNLNRYNKQVARQNNDTGDWDDHLDPEDRANLMGREFMGQRYR